MMRWCQNKLNPGDHKGVAVRWRKWVKLPTTASAANGPSAGARHSKGRRKGGGDFAHPLHAADWHMRYCPQGLSNPQHQLPSSQGKGASRESGRWPKIHVNKCFLLMVHRSCLEGLDNIWKT